MALNLHPEHPVFLHFPMVGPDVAAVRDGWTGLGGPRRRTTEIGEDAVLVGLFRPLHAPMDRLRR